MGSKQQLRTEAEFVRGSCVFCLSLFSKQMYICFVFVFMFAGDDFQGVSFAEK